MTNVIPPKRTHHPSFGVVTMERIGGYGATLVGSVSGVHPTAIRLTLGRGVRYDTGRFDDADHWSAAEQPFVVVEMTMLQWAELITLSGMGVTIPCTLRTVNGERMPDPPKNDSQIGRVLEDARADLMDGPDPSDEAIEELMALRRDISEMKASKAVKAALIQRLDEARSKLRRPGIVAQVAVETLGRQLATLASQARVEARLEARGPVDPAAAIDVSVPLALIPKKEFPVDEA